MNSPSTPEEYLGLAAKRGKPFEIQPQPDDTTCGPTCLHAVYKHFGDDISLEQLLDEVPRSESGGTLGVHLANHALALEDLTHGRLLSLLVEGAPIITGLSATFLYREARETMDTNQPDDIHGAPVGHFVVLTGYALTSEEVLVTDPLHPNRLSEQHTYPVPIERVIASIYLGVLTHDANLVILRAPKARA